MKDYGTKARNRRVREMQMGTDRELILAVALTVALVVGGLALLVIVLWVIGG